MPHLRLLRAVFFARGEIQVGVSEHPEIKSKIEERLRNVPEANRERAFINAAKTEAMNQTVRPHGVRV